jgi:hypothetical protein
VRSSSCTWDVSSSNSTIAPSRRDPLPPNDDSDLDGKPGINGEFEQLHPSRPPMMKTKRSLGQRSPREPHNDAFPHMKIEVSTSSHRHYVGDLVKLVCWMSSWRDGPLPKAEDVIAVLAGVKAKPCGRPGGRP